MSLNEALGLAGGPSQLNSDPSQVFVVRSTEENKTAGLSPERGIAAGISRWRRNSSCSPKTSYSWITAGLVRWNRFISNLFPSAQTVQTVNSIK